MVWAEYANFTVTGEDSLYQLHIGDYNGNAGDASMPGTDKALDEMKFSTVDHDNDDWEYNCALVVGGGFWYSNCEWMLVNSIVEKDKYFYWETDISAHYLKSCRAMLMCF